MKPQYFVVKSMGSLNLLLECDDERTPRQIHSTSNDYHNSKQDKVSPK